MTTTLAAIHAALQNLTADTAEHQDPIKALAAGRYVTLFDLAEDIADQLDREGQPGGIQAWDLPTFGWHALTGVQLAWGQAVSVWHRPDSDETLTIWYSDATTATAALLNGQPLNLDELPQVITGDHLGKDHPMVVDRLASWCWRARQHLNTDRSAVDERVADLLVAVERVCDTGSGETSIPLDIRHAMESLTRQILATPSVR